MASASTGRPAGRDIPLDCFVYPGWEPRIRAAPAQRDWMDATPERFAYRCLPLNIANAHGWELLSPCGFEAAWNGGPAVGDVAVRPDPGTPPHKAPVALFGQGVLTFHVDGLFRTPEGYNLWVGGSPNAAKDGLAPLSGVIESDWSPYSFTMNWRFTRAGHPIRFEENEPFCFLFPVERHLAEAVIPRILPIDDAPELKRQFESWSASRDAFQQAVAAHPPGTPSEKWQKFYYRGVHADGRAGTDDHRAKLRLPEFAGAEAYHRATSAIAACPVAHAQVAPGTSRDEDPSSAKLAWILNSLERLRALAPRAISRRANIPAEEFLAEHYAGNRPLVLEGALGDWPALSRWSPDYLKRLIGSQSVEIQANRDDHSDFERNMPRHQTRMAFDAFIDRICAPGSANNLYMTAHNAAANAAALAPLHADLGFFDTLLSRDVEHPHGMLWIGPAGTFTPLHHDLTNNLLLQIVGRKRVLLIAPGYTPRLYNDAHVYSRVHDLLEPGIASHFPALEGVHVHEVMLKSGDALFIPLGWWHQVSALDFSVTITHTNFRWANDFHADHPT